MKIVMVGPVYPYKGGISHYTGLMCKALRKKYDTDMISFKMQYPKLLFKKEQKDYDNEHFKVDATKYWLNTANPFTIVKTALRIRKKSPNLVIIQWWHPYFAPCYFLLQKCLGKYKTLIVCHNVFPHERFPLDRFLTGIALRGGDSYLVQSKTDEEDLLKLKPNARYKRVFHPTYNAFRMQNMTKIEAREILGIHSEERVMLFFGYVRKYKGLRHILEVVADVAQKVEHIKLLVVGDFGEDREEYFELIRKKKIEKYIAIVEGYIPDKEVEKYFAAADLAVLPYESATQSGIAQIAYGFRLPIVATDVGGLPEVVIDGKTGYVVEAGNDTALGDAIVRFFNETDIEAMQQNIIKEEYKYSWDRITEEIEKLVGLNE